MDIAITSECVQEFAKYAELKIMLAACMAELFQVGKSMEKLEKHISLNLDAPMVRAKRFSNRKGSTMFTRIFGKPKQETNALATLDKLNETLEMLEKKEKVLQKKASAEVERAKEFTRAKNKKAAIQCLKRKRLYEQQIEQLGNFQLRIHDQMIMLEGAKATTETVDALRTGASAMKAMQKATNIDDVDKTMDEINEQTENMKQIQEALSAPIGAAADFDEDELEAELEELEGAELEEQLLQPATTAPAAPVQVPAGRQPARPVPQRRTAEEDELAALQAEMAL
ncbi:Vacuolar protein sorting-associated protein 32-2-like protein [Morus notabilis]|uniref:Vacuolar protein sorting-associated protein 32-2-like protein n=2 Tax=Morus notabilis TaxID=981085 RepID=W9QLF8_9ROSA|nr:Vacuolar protein sorting-associated protein 32-2-like protein [Morus notabilis]